MSQTIEDAVRDSFVRRPPEAPRMKIELPTFSSGGYRPGVDIDSNAALLDLMDGIE